MVQKTVGKLGAQNVNGWPQNETDVFRAEVSHALHTGRRRFSGLHCDWRWNMGLSPQSWIQATVTAVLDFWPTVHHSITLVNVQLDAQNSYLFIYNTFIKILYMFRAIPCSSSGDLRRNCIYAASGIVTVCRWLSCAPVKIELSSFSLINLQTIVYIDFAM